MKKVGMARSAIATITPDGRFDMLKLLLSNACCYKIVLTASMIFLHKPRATTTGISSIVDFYKKLHEALLFSGVRSQIHTTESLHD